MKSTESEYLAIVKIGSWLHWASHIPNVSTNTFGNKLIAQFPQTPPFLWKTNLQLKPSRWIPELSPTCPKWFLFFFSKTNLFHLRLWSLITLVSYLQGGSSWSYYFLFECNSSILFVEERGKLFWVSLWLCQQIRFSETDISFRLEFSVKDTFF